MQCGQPSDSVGFKFNLPETMNCRYHAFRIHKLVHCSTGHKPGYIGSIVSGRASGALLHHNSSARPFYYKNKYFWTFYFNSQVL